MSEQEKSTSAPAYRITFKSNTDAIAAGMILEGERMKSFDVREGNKLFFSKEWWDKQLEDINDFIADIENVCMVAELDYTPEIEVVDYDFESQS